MSEGKTKKRVPVKRWLILGLFAIGIYVSFMGPTILRPINPKPILAAEPTGLSILGFQITNTILATLLADVLLLLVAYGAYRFVKSGQLVPKGFYNAFEAIFEFMWNSVEVIAGKWANRIFPVTATIFLLVFTANMIKMVPGFESIGRLEPVAEGQGYAAVQLFGLPIYTIDKGQPGEVTTSAAGSTEVAATAEAPAAEGLCKVCEIVPFLRGSATDLNFTFALAVVTMIIVQVFGVWANGWGYFGKFFPVGRLVSGEVFGTIDFFVGILEIILEIAKILSFGFRLFGNIFAGVLLLSVLGALTAVAVPAGLYLFEVFFGIIQAYVFFLLATVFISSATVSHHAGEEHA